MPVLEFKNGSGLKQYLNAIGTGTVADPFELSRPDYKVAYAVQQIADTYGDTVSVREKLKSLIKFGQNPDIDTNVREMVWSVGGIETLPTTNAIDEIVSDNPADTQQITIEGHTTDGSGNLTFVVQSATLTGTTPVTLTTPLARATRAYNNGATETVGTITVRESGGATHVSIPAGTQQSRKGATSVSQFDYWIIDQLVVGVNKAATAVVDFELQVRLKDKVFRTIYIASSGNSGNKIEFQQPIIVPPNSDVRVLATSNSNNVSVTSAIHGWLALKQ